MLTVYNTYDIAQHWITAIEYGDYSGLEDDEIQQLEDFLSELPEGHKYWVYADNTNFARDHITNLMADCVETQLYMSNELAENTK